MRALALTVAALAALPALGHAQTRGISTNPRSAMPSSGRQGSPAHSPRGVERRGREIGGGRRGRPVVIVVAPYDGYGYASSGAFSTGYLGNGYTGAGLQAGDIGSATTTRFTGSYAPFAPASTAPEAPDTTYVRYEPSTPAPARALDVVATTPAALSLAVQRVGGSLLRLRWTGGDPDVRAVTLVVADASRRVLAVQTVRGAPFSAVFDNAAKVAYVGTTAERDGVSTTTLVPVGRMPGVKRAPLPPIVRSGK